MQCGPPLGSGASRRQPPSALPRPAHHKAKVNLPFSALVRGPENVLCPQPPGVRYGGKAAAPHRAGLVPAMRQGGRTLLRGTHSAWVGHAGSIPFLSEHNDSSPGCDQLAFVPHFPPLPSPRPSHTYCCARRGAAGVGPERHRWACRLLEEKGTGKQETGSVLE